MPTPAARAEALDRHNRHARTLFAGLPDRYDGLVETLTFGQNARWRAAAVGAALGGGVDPPRLVLDVATGTAGLALQIAARSGARVAGVDLSPAMIAAGAANVAGAGPAGGQVRLALARAEELPFADATFDACTFSYLLRYVGDVAATLSELARVLRPGAPLAGLDFGVPELQPYRAVWWAYTRLVLPVAGLVAGGVPWWHVGRFLGPSIAGFSAAHPRAALVEAWHAAGLVDVHQRPMTFGGGLVMWARRAGG